MMHDVLDFVMNQVYLLEMFDRRILYPTYSTLSIFELGGSCCSELTDQVID